jgi:hypothetical protein
VKTVVVGGHSRNIGKTSVVAGIVRGLPELGWTAVKVTQFGHGVCTVDGKACHCSLEESCFAVEEERDSSGRTDTSRFLVAGARRSLWVRTRQGLLHEAMPSLAKLIENEAYVILESNSILRFLRPDLYLMVLDYATADFKASAKEYFDRADGYILLEPGTVQVPSWPDIPLDGLAKKPVFKVTPDNYVTMDILKFVRERVLADTYFSLKFSS